jgi:hypothetical protein
MADFTPYPNFDSEVSKAAVPGVQKVGTTLFSQVRANWNSASHIIKVTSRRTDDGYLISIGKTRASRTHTHLVEWGGARHSAKAPTRRAISAMGLRVKFK